MLLRPLDFGVCSASPGSARYLHSRSTPLLMQVKLFGAVCNPCRRADRGRKHVGMSSFLTFRRVVFPVAIRQALPAYGNEIILLVKATSSHRQSPFRSHCGRKNHCGDLPAYRGVSDRRGNLPHYQLRHYPRCDASRTVAKSTLAQRTSHEQFGSYHPLDCPNANAHAAGIDPGPGNDARRFRGSIQHPRYVLSVVLGESTGKQATVGHVPSESPTESHHVSMRVLASPETQRYLLAPPLSRTWLGSIDPRVQRPCHERTAPFP